MSEATSVEGEINAIVKEYMEHLKLEDTLRSFEAECLKKGNVIQTNAERCRQEEQISKVKEEFLEKFENGQRTEFFSLWDSQVNSGIVDLNAEAQKLEFMLHVHFSVFPLRKTDHWVQEEAEEAMFHFRYYLETGGSTMSSCPELLPYFALPYVQSASSHPSFETLFKNSWVIELKQKLERFLLEHLKRKLIKELDTPRLVDLYNKNDSGLEEALKELKLMEKKMLDCQKCYVAKSMKLDKLQDDCRQLMSLSNLLVTALESALKGDILDLDNLLSSCAERFPKAVFLKNGLNKANSINILEEIEEPNNDNQSLLLVKLQDRDVEKRKRDENHLDARNMFNLEPCCVPEFPLDFSKIQKKLCDSEERTKLLLLQALRWRLTKAVSKEQKERAVASFVKNDLLSLRHVVPKERLKFVQVMWTASLCLRQSIARFLNAFASFIKGREYLSQSPELLRALMDNLMVFKTKDPIITDMTLGALQKLSMRSVCQVIMIEAGFMEWLTETLKRFSKLSDYGQEYSVALLMNFCLCPLGKMKGELIKESLLAVLCNLLQIGKKNILGYVNGALYSLLSKPVIRQWAIDNNLEDTLLVYLKKYDPEIKRQLQCIVDLLHSDEELTSSSSEDDIDEEEADIEAELEMDDPVCAQSDEASGEILLWREYSIGLPTLIENVHPLDEKSIILENSVISENLMMDELSSNLLLPPVSRGHSSTHRSHSIPPSDLILNDQTNDSLISVNSSFQQPITPEPISPKLDVEATQLVRKIVGQNATTLVEAAIVPDPTPANIKGLNVNEYMVAFSSRPKIPRTPELPSPGGSKRSRSQNSLLSPRLARSVIASDLGLASPNLRIDYTLYDG